MAISILVALVLGFIVARGFAKPLTAMTAIAEYMSGGNYNQRVSIERKDEIGSLGKALNKMAWSSHERLEIIALDNNKLLAILSGMVEGVIAVDKSETIIHLNEAAARILGISSKENIHRRIWEVTYSQELCQVFSVALNEKTEIRRKLKIVTSSTDQIVEIHASPFRDAGGELVGAVAILHDVSELERLETIRRDFVANVSHELKTPITAIHGLVETLIDDEEMSPENHHLFLTKTMNQTLRLSAIVSVLLALSRLESAGLDLIRTPLDLRDVVTASIQVLLPISEKKTYLLKARFQMNRSKFKGIEKRFFNRSIIYLITPLNIIQKKGL
jgi:two-component system phosphate regulon sensor histidine kinase PhoR